MSIEDVRGVCQCFVDGIGCRDLAVPGERFCANCLDGECKNAALNALGLEAKDVGAEAEAQFEPDPRTVLEAQIVALVRKHALLDQTVEALDDEMFSEQRKAAGHILDAMSELDAAIFKLLYEWAEV